MATDPIVDEVRRVRNEHAARFNYDLKAIYWDLKEREKMSGRLPRDRAADVIGRQLIRSATSVGANYREANRAESRNDFVHKIGIVEKEASETQSWLELCIEGGVGDVAECEVILQESGELLAIFTSVCKTAKARRTPKP